MLYPTLTQPAIFFSLLAAGLLSGLAFDLANFGSYLCNKNKIVLHIFQFVATVCCFVLFYFVNLFVNYGQLRFYAIAAFLIGLIAERLASENFIAKNVKKLYNLKRGKGKTKKDS